MNVCMAQWWCRCRTAVVLMAVVVASVAAASTEPARNVTAGRRLASWNLQVPDFFLIGAMKVRHGSATP